MVNYYHPTGPYTFQSGKRRGRTLELLMFEDYQFLNWFYHQKINGSGGGKNRLEKHLGWLLEKGENRKPKMMCPHCRKYPVAYFSILFSANGNDFSAGSYYSCCEDCIDELKAMAFEKTPSLLPIRFSSLLLFRKKEDRRRIAKMYRIFYQLPGKMGKKKAFNFFKG
ncbi:MAG: hypothetical protein K9M12_02035 [Candidatus Pacebacteria bacterium]|nr:hypothetical protein [Candidatus Paceibacterota bacterium]